MVKIEDNRNYLREILESYNISQTEMARKIGQSRINFNKIVNNNRKLDVETARKIGKIINRSWFELYEPIEMIVQVHGEINQFVGEQKAPEVELNDPIYTTPRYIRLDHFISDVKNLICLYDPQGSSAWLLKKSAKSKSIPDEQYGMFMVKHKNGSLGFVNKSFDGKLRKYDPSVDWENKKIKKADWEYAIPLSRIDWDWDWVNEKGEILKDIPK